MNGLRVFSHSLFVRTLVSLWLLGALLTSTVLCRADQWIAPEGLIQLSRPTISLNVWAAGNSRITATYMAINGEEVPAHYSLSERLLSYTPPQSLPPGTYTVLCKAMLSTGQVGNRQWQFRVAAGALADVPEPNADQVAAFNAANVFRRKMGLPEFHLNRNLCAAAQSHCLYIKQNKGGGHEQETGKIGFTGVGPSDRAAAFLFRRGCGECISYGGSPAEATIHLVSAPYHRGPFQKPGLIEVGAGHLTGTTVFDFAGDNTAGITVYPLPNQSEIPLVWGGGESPNPLRIHKMAGKGYIITLMSYGPHSKLRVQEAHLTTASGKEVPCLVNTPANDDRLPNGVFLIPRDSLAPGTTFVATIKAVREDGRDASREWRFTTKEERPDLSLQLFPHVEVQTREGKQVWSVTLTESRGEKIVPLNLYYVDAAGKETRQAVASISPWQVVHLELTSATRIVSARLVPLYKGQDYNDAEYPAMTITLKPEQKTPQKAVSRHRRK